MDVHRIYGYVYETLGEYNLAIQEYQKAIAIAPNLNLLKIRVGKIYRHLQLYDQALQIFDLAANQNQQLGINDPIPYLAIANTYIETGDFFAAAANVKKALTLNPSSPDVYAQLGMVHHASRNYEGAIPAFECASQGCDGAKSCAGPHRIPMRPGNCEPQIVITGYETYGRTRVAYYYTFVSVLARLRQTGGCILHRSCALFYGNYGAVMRVTLRS